METPSDNLTLGDDVGAELSNEDELEESPLVRALREHLARYYSSGDSEEPFSSRNQIRPTGY